MLTYTSLVTSVYEHCSIDAMLIVDIVKYHEFNVYTACDYSSGCLIVVIAPSASNAQT